MPPCARTSVTTPETTLFGRVGGSDAMTSSTTPLSAGVAGPHADVYSVVWPETGLSLRSSWRRWLVPRHVPSNATRATASVPSGAMPRLEREDTGASSSVPPRMTIPVAGPFPAKKSPFTPTSVPSRSRPSRRR